MMNIFIFSKGNCYF